MLPIQTVAIVPAIALVLILMMAALTYAPGSPIAAMTRRRRGASARPGPAHGIAFPRLGRDSAEEPLLRASEQSVGARVIGKVRDLTRRDPSARGEGGEREAKRAEPEARQLPPPAPPRPARNGAFDEPKVERPPAERPAGPRRPGEPSLTEPSEPRPRRRRAREASSRSVSPRTRGSATYVPLGDDRIALTLEHNDAAVQGVVCCVRDPEGRVWAAERVSVLLPRRYGLVYPSDFDGASPLREGTFRVEWLRRHGAAEAPLATLEMSATEQDVGATGAGHERSDTQPKRSAEVSAVPSRLEAVAQEPGPDPRPRGTPAEDELEILKAKLGKPSASVLDRRANEVETLKSKLDAGGAPGEGETASSAPARSTADDRTTNGSDGTLTGEATTCRIAWKRAGSTSFFCALAATAAGESVIAQSPRFRASDPVDRPDDRRAQHAHRVLLESLGREGWSVSGRGDEWYTLELRRRPEKPRGIARANDDDFGQEDADVR